MYNPNDSSNLEVLEFLGDSVLKLLGSIEVYVNNQLVMEGDLHRKRAQIVQNEYLKQIAIKQKMYIYLLCNKTQFYPGNFIVKSINA